MKESEGSRAGVGGICVLSSGRPWGGVGRSGPNAPVITIRFVGSFQSKCGRNSVTGLKGSLSKCGNLWISEVDLSSVLGLCGETSSLSGSDAGGPGCKRAGNDFIYYSFIYPGKIIQRTCCNPCSSIYYMKNMWVKATKAYKKTYFVTTGRKDAEVHLLSVGRWKVRGFPNLF